MSGRPPMDPSTDEADERQLQLAREQGEAYLRAATHMIEEVAQTGATSPAGDLLVGVALEEAEGMYALDDGVLRWQEPEGNLHVEVVVMDGADHRFVPNLEVSVTILDEDGSEVGSHPHPLLWHPMLYHYGRNWEVPGDGTYTLRVHVEPAAFMRHDEVNGKRYAEAVDVEFRDLTVRTGQD